MVQTKVTILTTDLDQIMKRITGLSYQYCALLKSEGIEMEYDMRFFNSRNYLIIF